MFKYELQLKLYKCIVRIKHNLVNINLIRNPFDFNLHGTTDTLVSFSM